jgi:hypothetical protein
MNDQEMNKAPIPPLRYVDEKDRAWQELMQEPETQDYIRNTFLDVPPEDWPDTIFLADLPQVPSEQIDVPLKQKVGRCEGPIQNRKTAEFVPTDVLVTFFNPEATRFVRVVLQDGREVMERYNKERHGEWDQIPDTGLTPAELIQRLYGFGDTLTDWGNQFATERKKKGGARKKHWEPKYHPKPNVRGVN